MAPIKIITPQRMIVQFTIDRVDIRLRGPVFVSTLAISSCTDIRMTPDLSASLGGIGHTRRDGSSDGGAPLLQPLSGILPQKAAGR